MTRYMPYEPSCIRFVFEDSWWLFLTTVSASVKSKGAMPESRHRRKALAAADTLEAHVCKVADDYPNEQKDRIDALCAARAENQS